MTSGRSAQDWKFWTLAILVTICVLLNVVNLRLGSGVSELRMSVAERQQFIAESVPLARVNTQIIQTLANMSSQSNDAAIRAMLARHGVTFSSTEPEPPGQGDAP